MNEVLIKGMEMPRTCDMCWALDDYGDYPRCRITEEQRGYNFPIREKRMDKCPLISVPTPHGKLIDAHELYSAIIDKGQRNERGKYRIGEYWELTGREIREVINAQPPIIEEEMDTK